MNIWKASQTLKCFGLLLFGFCLSDSASIVNGQSESLPVDPESIALVQTNTVKRIRLVQFQWDLRWRSIPQFFEPDLTFDDQLDRMLLDDQARDLLQLETSQQRELVRLSKQIQEQRKKLAPWGSYGIGPFGSAREFEELKRLCDRLRQSVVSECSKGQLTALGMLLQLRNWAAVKVGAARAKDLELPAPLDRYSLEQFDEALGELRSKMDQDELRDIVQGMNEVSLAAMEELLPGYVDTESLRLPALPVRQLILGLQRARDLAVNRQVYQEWNQLGEDDYFFPGPAMEIGPLGRLNVSALKMAGQSVGWMDHVSYHAFQCLDLSREQFDQWNLLKEKHPAWLSGTKASDEEDFLREWEDWKRDVLLPGQRKQLQAYTRLQNVYALNPAVIAKHWEGIADPASSDFRMRLESTIKRLEQKEAEAKKKIRKLLPESRSPEDETFASAIFLMDYDLVVAALTEKK